MLAWEVHSMESAVEGCTVEGKLEQKDRPKVQTGYITLPFGERASSPLLLSLQPPRARR